MGVTIDLTRRRLWGLVPVVVVVTAVIAIRSQRQVGIAQSFLDALKNGDRKAAEALSDASVRAAVARCFDGSCGDGPADQAVKLARTSAVSSTSANVHTGWNERCVESGVRTPSGRHDLFLRLELRGDAWLVTGLSETRDDLGICRSD
ncbi:MAG: hypothetical protein HOO96_17970 [Polyangiaceae bacterium]|nr:hypothetical protein [Polyangiaceae bacterium]